MKSMFAKRLIAGGISAVLASGALLSGSAWAATDGTVGFTSTGTLDISITVNDEVRISNVARYTEDFTPEERFEPDEHTLALYHFDEGEGNVLIDSSHPFGHHAESLHYRVEQV